MRIASFDIGKNNFAFCIEEFDSEELVNIKNISSILRYNTDGTPKRLMESILNKVYNNGKIILIKNLNLTANCDPKKKLDPETYHNMIDALDLYSSYWETCKAFVIEEQMSFGAKVNKMAVKLAQHCYSYFTFKYGRFKEIIEFPAYHKTQILGAPKIQGKKYKSGKIKWTSMKKSNRKKWAVDKGLEILKNRKELDTLEIINKSKKKDDLCDVIIQLQAFKYLVYVNKKL